VLFVGHRGEDFYDLNMELRRILQLGTVEKHRFLCIPHMGDMGQVSSSYEALFGKRRLGKITTMQDDWIGDLFDTISGSTTPSSGDLPDVVGLGDVTEDFLKLVDNHSAVGSPSRLAIQKQCAALLDDLRVGCLAAWSVIEGYRLESLGYTQAEIAAFGRPKKRKYHHLPIEELISLQKDYQLFREAWNTTKTQNLTSDGDIVENGLELADKMEKFASNARNAFSVCTDGIQKAICRLLAAIPYNYCGLVGMRLMAVIHAPSNSISALHQIDTLEMLLAHIDKTSIRGLASNASDKDKASNGMGLRTELLFNVSAALAKAAGNDLKTEAAKLYSDAEIQEAYAENLSQIVGWQDWEFAPTENRLRLQFIDMNERLDCYEIMIGKRIGRIAKEASGLDTSGLSFSAAADAAQCAVRVGEVARLLAGVGDFGIVVRDENLIGTPVAKRILEKIPSWGRICIDAARESSSVPNHLILLAYDGLLLESLLTGSRDLLEILKEARLYAEDAFGLESRNETGIGFQFARCMRGIESRVNAGTE